MNIRLIVVSVFGLIVLCIINFYNLNAYNHATDRSDVLIKTADEPSYFAPARNFYKRGEWKDNFDGFSSYYQRPPGYGFLYYLSLKLKVDNSFAILRLLQILLFGASIFLFGKILELLKISSQLVLIGTFLYAVLPCFSGFTFYSLSESLIPFMVTFSLFALLYWNRFKGNLIKCLVLLILGCFTLVRPQILVFYFPLVLLILKNFKPISLLFLVVLCLPFGIWSVRNYSIKGEIVGIHPIYDNTNQNVFRSPHQSLTSIFKYWEWKPENFHEVVGTLRRDTTFLARTKCLEKIPKDILDLHEEKILLSFKHFQLGCSRVRLGRASNGLSNEEKEALLVLNDLELELTETHLLDRVFWVPLKSIKSLVAKSYLNLYIFQSTWKNSIVAMILKVFCFTLLFFGLGVSILNLFTDISSAMKVFNISMFLYLFYLGFIQVLNEDRYYFFILPLLLVNLVIFVESLTLSFKRGNIYNS